MAENPTIAVLVEVRMERHRQDAKWGEANHPDGTGAMCIRDGRPVADPIILEVRRERAQADRQACDEAACAGRLTWRHILREEVSEACAEDDPAKLRAELVQVAAVAVKWIEAIDRREARASRKEG